ncbi:hypothetical protein ACH5RR_024139 [Cinchona calisaya]|uniref:C2 domain-containing protein n=1 Tax=Cinchona calisaya TaxID=153742 RepID=A0ABD2ZFQ9_9GENT
MASSLGKNSRIIEIEVKSAKLNSKEVGNFYVRISIGETQELQTKSVKFLKTITFPWNQKFVFSVPENFIFDEKSTISFTLFKARRYLSDIVVGKATGEMKALFPVDECKEDDGGGKAAYDKDEEEVDTEPEIQEKETFELKAEVGIPILKESCVVGTLNVSIVAWEEYYLYEVNLYGRWRKSFSIFRGSEKIGNMVLQKAKQQKYISFVGNVKWRNLAMGFDELMVKKEANEKKPTKKRSSLGMMCFAANASNGTMD